MSAPATPAGGPSPLGRPRKNRHRVVPDGPVPPADGAERADGAATGTEITPARAPRRLPPVAPGVGLYAPSPGGLTRPAQLSERCSGCGSLTRGQTTMVTELVQVGPVRALRVVACSACPEKRLAAHAGPPAR